MSLEFNPSLNLNKTQDGKPIEKKEETGMSRAEFNSAFAQQIQSSGGTVDTSIFNNATSQAFAKADTNPKDNQLNAVEQAKAFTSASEIYAQMMQEVSGTQGVNDVSGVQGAQNAQEVGQATVDFALKFVNASPEEQKAMIQQELNDLKAAGYDVKSMSADGTITIGNPDGSIGTINIYDAMGVERPQDTEGTQDKGSPQANMASVLDGYSARGFEPTGNPKIETIDGKQVMVGTMQNAQGEQIEIKIDMETGKEIKE